MIRKATASKGNSIWTDELDHDNVRVRKTMLTQISLTPYDENILDDSKNHS